MTFIPVSITSPPKRPRGAQPRDLSALERGFYFSLMEYIRFELFFRGTNAYELKFAEL